MILFAIGKMTYVVDLTDSQTDDWILVVDGRE